MTTERFAPSPTGLLHLGHAFSAFKAYEAARKVDGQFLLRIEDIDFNRCKTGFENQIYDDLHWLGIRWNTPVMRQSERRAAYDGALDHMWKSGFLFGCSCSRKDIAISSAPQEGGDALIGPDGVVYPGACRKIKQPFDIPNVALRFNLQRIEKETFSFEDESGLVTKFTKADVQKYIGEVVLARKDIGISYHLAVVLDDAAQGVTHVTRGEDLFEATKIHVLLQHVLGLPTPVYRHHKLIRDEHGKRLAKRDDARSIRSYRDAGMSVDQVLSLING